MQRYGVINSYMAVAHTDLVPHYSPKPTAMCEGVGVPWLQGPQARRFKELRKSAVSFGYLFPELPPTTASDHLHGVAWTSNAQPPCHTKTLLTRILLVLQRRIRTDSS